MPDWDDLRFFLAVHREGSLADAGRQLKVDATTVGRRITALERALGARLFDRLAGGWTLTDAGRGVQAGAEEVERSVLGLQRRLTGLDRRVEGTVRLTSSETFHGYVVRSLAALRAVHPDLVVELLVGNQTLDLTRREADLALRMARTPQPELVTRRVAVFGWSLYASERYLATVPQPPAPHAMAGHAIVAFDGAMAGVPGAVWLRENAADARVALRTNSLLAAYAAVAEGMGVSVLPCFLGEDPRLRRLTPEVLGGRDAYLVTPVELLHAARVRTVMDWLTEWCRRDQALLAGLTAT